MTVCYCVRLISRNASSSVVLCNDRAVAVPYERLKGIWMRCTGARWSLSMVTFVRKQWNLWLDFATRRTYQVSPFPGPSNISTSGWIYSFSSDLWSVTQCTSRPPIFPLLRNRFTQTCGKDFPSYRQILRNCNKFRTQYQVTVLYKMLFDFHGWLSFIRVYFLSKYLFIYIVLWKMFSFWTSSDYLFRMPW